MDQDRIRDLKGKIEVNKAKIGNENDFKKKEILRLKIKIDELKIKIERLK
jgi:hypothetical protein